MVLIKPMYNITVYLNVFALKLYKKGFKNLDALEPSPKMLDRVRETGCYHKLHEEYMGKNRVNIKDGNCGTYV